MDVLSLLPNVAGAAGPLEPALLERLERGEIISFPACPFALPGDDDRGFLRRQRLNPFGHKAVSYDPHTGRVGGFRRRESGQEERLRALLGGFSRAATAWLAGLLPRYAGSWTADRAALHPEEEATRRLRPTARNDLLHVDAFPTRPTHGRRILRLFVNLNPTDPRVWATADPFPALLERFGRRAGLPSAGGGTWVRSLREGLWRVVRPGGPRRSPYDDFMLRLHHYLKANESFQERTAKRVWRFPPGSAWLAFTDTVSYAVLRGRWALEHSYLVSPASLALPDEAPVALLARACKLPVVDCAA
jgi:hypothetical protein